jgi:hypothetical protein
MVETKAYDLRKHIIHTGLARKWQPLYVIMTQRTFWNCYTA